MRLMHIRSYLFFILTALVALMFTACNLREDPLLPPGLNPSSYSTSSVIGAYRDHLIASANDDSYIYIRREMIGEGGLAIGDRVVFSRVVPFLERDSLAFPGVVTARTGTYQFHIIREGVSVTLSGIANLAEVFTDSWTDRGQEIRLIHLDHWLTASSIYPIEYHRRRLRFSIAQTGVFCLVNTPDNCTLNIGSHQTGRVTHGWFYGEGNDWSIRFKDNYLTSVTELVLSASSDLSAQEITTLQSLFPGFAINSSALRVQVTGNIGSDSYALVRTTLPSSRVMQQQWTKIAADGVSGWLSGEDTWQVVAGELYAFIQDSGSYVLGSPLAGQGSLAVPLDAGWQRVFLQTLWLDLRGVDLSGWTMQIDLQPEIQKLLGDYFRGTPYTIGDHSAYGVTFRAHGEEMEKLPDDLWIEFGFATDHPIGVNSRLFLCRRTHDRDHITFKTSAQAYDAEHFTANDGFVYAGIVASGIYLLAETTEHPTQLTIPCLKPRVHIQTARIKLDWDDPAVPDATTIAVNLAPTIDQSHPWLSGYPYRLSKIQPLAEVQRQQGKTKIQNLPAQFRFSISARADSYDLVTISNLAGHPRLKVHSLQSASGDNQYYLDNGWLSLYPDFGGVYFKASLTTDLALRYPIAYYPLMEFNTHDLKVFTDSSYPVPTNTILAIEKRNALPDQYGILANQYTLVQSSQAYNLTINEPLLLASVPSRIYFFAPDRSSRHLFSESSGMPYRIYPYYHSPVLSDWHYTRDAGYVSFLLTMPGTYALHNDLDPHQVVTAPVLIPLTPHHTSLYQAQMSIPPYFIPLALPLGSQAIMSRETSIPGMPNALYGYRIIFRNPQGMPINPAFIDNHVTDQYPRIYIPINDPALIPAARIIFRPVTGGETELIRVPGFTANFRNEFVMVGNCALCFVNQPGIFIVR